MTKRDELIKRLMRASPDVSSVCVELQAGKAAIFSAPAELPERVNEDAAGLWEMGVGTVLAVADGMGGRPGGADAAATAIEALDRRVSGAQTGGLRASILDAFEAANREILDSGSGGGTTLVVVEVVDEIARVYHAGDSGALIVGQRGRLRFESVNHSPCGFGVAAGLLDRIDVPEHPERHLLSNHVGSDEMHIEIGPSIDLALFDTIVLASDGILDNVLHDELIDGIRSGPLVAAADGLREAARSAMRGEVSGFPAYPDDATAIVFRRARPSRGRSR